MEHTPPVGSLLEDTHLVEIVQSRAQGALSLVAGLFAR